MEIKWNIEGAILSINQTFFKKWIYKLIGVLGVGFFIIGAIGIAVQLSDFFSKQALSISLFSTTLLTFHFFTTLGIAMISVNSSSRSVKNYSEKIVFNNNTERVELYCGGSAQNFYELPYGDISNIQTYKWAGGPDYPDVYMVFLIKNDGAKFWITGFDSDEERFLAFVIALAQHTGFAVRDASNLGTEKAPHKKYAPRAVRIENRGSKSVSQSVSPASDVFTVKQRKQGVFSYLLAFIVYLFFMSVPLYIFNGVITPSAPPAVQIVAIVFISIWTCILLLTLMLSIRDYRVIVNSGGIRIELRMKGLKLLISSMFIPSGFIKYVRTNRLDGCNYSLSLGVGEGFKVFFMNLPALKKMKSIRNEKEISLWEIPPSVNPEASANIYDLRYIEESIQKRLGLIEKIIK